MKLSTTPSNRHLLEDVSSLPEHREKVFDNLKWVGFTKEPGKAG